jgi:hypothetical protein
MLWIAGLVGMGLGWVFAIALAVFTLLIPVLWYCLPLMLVSCWWAIHCTSGMLSLKHQPSSKVLMVTATSLALTGGIGLVIGLLNHESVADLVFSGLGGPNPHATAADREWAFLVISTLTGLYAGSFLALQTLVHADRLESGPVGVRQNPHSSGG